QLAWTITAELQACLDAVRTNRTEWKNVPVPSRDEMIRLYEQWSKELGERAAALDEGAWTRPAQMYYEGKLVFDGPVGRFLWDILCDCIDHGGQLSAYLRPMGGKVPSIYGPSADDPGR